MKIKYVIISLLVLLTGLFYACKKSTSQEVASPVATCEFTVKGHYNDTIMPNTILYFYDNEAKYEASKSSLTGDLNANFTANTDSLGKLKIELPSNKQYWVRAITKVTFTRFNNYTYYFNNDDLNNASLVLISGKKQKVFNTIKVDNESLTLLVVYSSGSSLIPAKVQVKNKTTNKVISKSFGTASKDSISQVSATQPNVVNTTLGDDKKCAIYLVKKGTYTIKTLSVNGLRTTQDIDITGGGTTKYVDIKGKEIVTAANGIKLTFFSKSTNLSAFPYEIYINGESVGYLNESLISSAVDCTSPNSTKIFTVIIPKAVANNYTYSFAFQSSIPSSASLNSSFKIDSSLSCQNIEVK